jgi:putative transposase
VTRLPQDRAETDTGSLRATWRVYPRVMARPPRVTAAGALYHVTSRGNRRQRTYRDSRDYERFLDLTSRVVEERAWHCHAYCLMPNHFHLLLETPEDDLSVGMHWLKTTYAVRFNKRHELDGHLFQGRFHSVVVTREEHLIWLSRYIVRNPVRAGLCSHPGDWPWSSYQAAAQDRPRPEFLTIDWLLRVFDDDLDRARAAYLELAGDVAA